MLSTDNRILRKDNTFLDIPFIGRIGFKMEARVDKRNVIFFILDVNRIWLPDNEQPVMDLKWQQRTNCTPTNDTGPCRGSKDSIVKCVNAPPTPLASWLCETHKLHLVRVVITTKPRYFLIVF